MYWSQMRERYWIRLLPWKKKNKPNTKSGQIKFVPKLMITREHDWQYLELQIVNCSSWSVWVQEAAVILIDPDGKLRATGSQGRARYEILLNVRPKDTLKVRLARTIYDAAGRPAEPYSRLVRMNVRYRVFGEWCNARLKTYRVKMAALRACSLYSASWYDLKMKQPTKSIIKRVSTGAK
jgi:hypothetical protein